MGRQWDSEKQEFVDDEDISESVGSGRNYFSKKEFPEFEDRNLANKNYTPPKPAEIKFPKKDGSDDSE